MAPDDLPAGCGHFVTFSVIEYYGVPPSHGPGTRGHPKDHSTGNHTGNTTAHERGNAKQVAKNDFVHPHVGGATRTFDDLPAGG